MFNFKLCALFLLAVMAGCDFSETREETPEKKSYTKEELIEINRQTKAIEEKRINRFVERSGLPFVKTESGLRYHIYHRSDTELQPAKEGQIAEIEFVVTLLTGDTAYQSPAGKSAEFLVGMDRVESGLHEGVTYLRPGDKAKLILPPHLAHGLVGDLNKIPMNAAIIYDLHLLGVK